MRRELYLECYTGISCRKLLGALLALGAEKEELEQRLTCLAQCLVSIEAQYENQGIEEVVLRNIETAYLVFKTKEETEKKIAESPWGEKTKTALYRLWEISLQSEEESFLEGAAAWLALEILGFEQLQVLSVTETMDSRDGEILPCAKLLQSIEKYQVPMHFIRGQKEKSSLLGMELLGIMGKPAVFPDRVCIEKTGVGSVITQENSFLREGLRAVVLTESVPEKTEIQRQRDRKETAEKQNSVRVLETNVDDCSGEQLGYAIDCLMKAGALDASCFPIYMKKGRPAYMLQVICRENKQEVLEDIIFRETTSIGLRRYEEKRRVLPRTFEEVVLKDGHRVRIKVCFHHGKRFCYPEYETVKQICEETGRAFRDVYDEASAAAGGYYENL